MKGDTRLEDPRYLLRQPLKHATFYTEIFPRSFQDESESRLKAVTEAHELEKQAHLQNIQQLEEEYAEAQQQFKSLKQVLEDSKPQTRPASELQKVSFVILHQATLCMMLENLERGGGDSSQNEELHERSFQGRDCLTFLKL